MLSFHFDLHYLKHVEEWTESNFLNVLTESCRTSFNNNQYKEWFYYYSFFAHEFFIPLLIFNWLHLFRITNLLTLIIQYSRNFKLVFLSIYFKANNLRTSNSTLTRILFGDWILSTENCIYRYPQAGILIFGFIEFNDLFESVVISQNQPKYNVLTYLLHMYLVVNDANTVIILCFISLNYVSR